MKRTHLWHLAALVAGVALVVSCDQRTPLTPNIIGGGSTGGGVKGAPVLTIDTLNPSPVNIGDSIFIVVHALDDSSLRTVQFQGLTVHGSVDLGTLTTTNRYITQTVPAVGGSFRSGLRDTIIKRYLMPTIPLDTT